MSKAQTFEEILKFNPFHDARGRFATARGMASYSANPKTKAGAMAIQRSTAAGYGAVMNVHRESKGENIHQNNHWINSGAKPSKSQLARAQANAPKDVASARSRAHTNRVKGTMGATKEGPPASGTSSKPKQQNQQPKTPPKPKKNYDKLGFADHDDATFHQLHSGKQYYQQQKLTTKQQKAVNNYLEAHTESGSLYSHSQNMNWQMTQGTKLTGKYKQTHDGLMSAMHNIGYNVNLTRYDHAGMVNGMLKAVGAGSNYEKMSVSKIKKALVGQTVNENKFLSCSYNDFKNAPQGSKNVFDTRAVKINYKVKADVQAMMPGKGPGGDLGEMILAPTNGTTNRGGKIVDVRLTGQMVRRKGTQTYNQPRIEIDIEI